MKFGQKPIYEANRNPVLEWVTVKKYPRYELFVVL